MADEDDATVAGDPLRGLVASHPALRQLSARGSGSHAVGTCPPSAECRVERWCLPRAQVSPSLARVRASEDSLDAVHPEDREVVAGQWRRLRADGLAAVDTDVQRWAALNIPLPAQRREHRARQCRRGW